MKLIDKIDKILKRKKLEVPKCYSDDEFMYCWCGKCEPKNYELPKDFQRLLATKVVEEYVKNKSNTRTQ